MPTKQTWRERLKQHTRETAARERERIKTARQLIPTLAEMSRGWDLRLADDEGDRLLVKISDLANRRQRPKLATLFKAPTESFVQLCEEINHTLEYRHDGYTVEEWCAEHGVNQTTMQEIDHCLVMVILFYIG